MNTPSRVRAALAQMRYALEGISRMPAETRESVWSSFGRLRGEVYREAHAREGENEFSAFCLYYASKRLTMSDAAESWTGMSAEERAPFVADSVELAGMLAWAKATA